MKHFILSVFAVAALSFSSFAAKKISPKAPQKQKAKTVMLKKVKTPPKMDCIYLNTSCGVSGDLCCVSGGCSTWDFIIAAILIDDYYCGGAAQ